MMSHRRHRQEDRLCSSFSSVAWLRLAKDLEAMGLLASLHPRWSLRKELPLKMKLADHPRWSPLVQLPLKAKAVALPWSLRKKLPQMGYPLEPLLPLLALFVLAFQHSHRQSLREQLHLARQ